MTEKELRKFFYDNRKRAWKEFYPEGNGKAKHGHVLHHKDPSWKTEDPVRYSEWRHDDLEMLTISEHVAVHTKLQGGPNKDKKLSQSWKENIKSGMIGKCSWFTDGITELRGNVCPDGFHKGRLPRSKQSNLKTGASLHDYYKTHVSKNIGKSPSNKGKHCWHNASGKVKFTNECPGEGWLPGRK